MSPLDDRTVVDRVDDVVFGDMIHTYRQVERWTVYPSARVEILDRILWLNHEHARAEGQDAPVTEKWWSR